MLIILPLLLGWLVSSQQVKRGEQIRSSEEALPVSVSSWSVSNLVTGSTRDKITEKEAALYADHQCWQASTPVTEENLLGSDLTTTVFSLGWCTDGSAITYLSNLTYTSSSLNSYGYTRCVNFSIDSEGTAETRLTC